MATPTPPPGQETVIVVTWWDRPNWQRDLPVPNWWEEIPHAWGDISYWWFDVPLTWWIEVPGAWWHEAPEAWHVAPYMWWARVPQNWGAMSNWWHLMPVWWWEEVPAGWWTRAPQTWRVVPDMWWTAVPEWWGNISAWWGIIPVRWWNDVPVEWWNRMPGWWLEDVHGTWWARVPQWWWDIAPPRWTPGPYLRPAALPAIRPRIMAAEGTVFHVLVIQTSGAMQGRPFHDARIAAQRFVDGALGVGGHYVAIVSFDAAASVRAEFTRDRGALMDAINGLRVGGGTNMHAGLEEADWLVRNITREHDAANVFLFTNGLVNQGPQSAAGPFGSAHGSQWQHANAVVNATDRMIGGGVNVWHLGFFHGMSGSRLASARELANASNSRGLYDISDAADLTWVFD